MRAGSRAALLALLLGAALRAAAEDSEDEADLSGGREFREMSPGEIGRGFGKYYDWHQLDTGLASARETGKPIMLVMHKSWCQMCRRLGPLFAFSREVQQRASNFTLVNCMDEDPGCESPGYMPDGGYIPRILFLDSDGNVQRDLTAPDHPPQYKYFYSSAQQVARGMDAAMAAFARRVAGSDAPAAEGGTPATEGGEL
eukprot:TRINITY_DN61197_c0_g1_i1.p1 TRINITY_DN61197_c0_g1~~TRINITY_DN61197_c0_g1_i1.p1  ORF type:complete len:226 (+),score=72.61 TRINITY_DN61197_c0_g1_i1:82-678(+)